MARCLSFCVVWFIVIGMKVKFNNSVVVDFVDHRETEMSSKTFYTNQVTEVASVEETVRGFVDLIYENGDVAVGVPKKGLTIL